MRPVTPDDAGLIADIRRRYGHELSSHAFQSLYLWQDSMGLTIDAGAELLAVRAAHFGGNAWFFPCGSDAAKAEMIRRALQAPGLHLLYLRREDVDWLEQRCPGRFMFERTPASDEYLYDRDSHIARQGPRFKRLRAQVGRIERNCAPRTEWIDARNLEDVRRITATWMAASHPESTDHLIDSQVAMTAIRNWEALHLQGVVIYLGDVPSAYMSGFPLAHGVFDVSVGKCARPVQGLTFYAFCELFRMLPQQYALMNLEEDMGLDGLRNMKKNFLPDGMNETWEAHAR